MGSIHKKTIWITGASSGIGKSLALELSLYPCNLILSSRKEIELNKVKELCGGSHNVSVLPLDLKDYDEMESLTQKAISFYGKIDVLINNAGISQRSLILDTKLKVYEQLIAINYLGTVALSKAVLPHFIANKTGHFVTVTSLIGKFGSPYRSGYCGAKHALHGFFDVMRMEHEKKMGFKLHWSALDLCVPMWQKMHLRQMVLHNKRTTLPRKMGLIPKRPQKK
jgi:short-subunit dehydrogenase